jgi:hypothetical protein
MCVPNASFSFAGTSRWYRAVIGGNMNKAKEIEHKYEGVGIARLGPAALLDHHQ